MDTIEFSNPDKMQEIAEGYFLQGYNCCQSVLLAYSDYLGISKETVLKMSSGLGGGMARMREVCGAVTAMAIIAGFIIPATDPAKHEERTENYALVQSLASRFKDEKGSIICREILGLRKGQTESPSPSIRTPEYYRTRPCAKNVGLAARIVSEYLHTRDI